MKNHSIWIAVPVAVVVAVVMTQTRAPAQQAGGGVRPAGVIDIVKVFNNYQQTKDLNEAFDGHRQRIKGEADKRGQVLTTRKEALKSYKPTDPDYKTQFMEVQRMEVDMKAWLTLQEQDIMQKHKVWLQRTYENICDVAAAVATKRGFDLVLTYDELNAEEVADSATLRQRIVLRTVIYSAAQNDITDDVLNQLNLKYKSSGGVKITF